MSEVTPQEGELRITPASFDIPSADYQFLLLRLIIKAARIMSHMNKDHPSSLSHYLEHYGRIPSSLADLNPTITAFGTPSMKIEYGPEGGRKSYEHAFAEPMLAGQARKRLEEMHKEARRGLGISEVVVNEFWSMMDAMSLFSLFVLVALQIAIVAGPPKVLTAYLPWGAKQVGKVFSRLDITQTPERLGWGIKLFFTIPFYFLHGVECVTVLQGLFKKYNTTDKTVRLQWIVATLAGGFGVWGRFKRRAAEMEAALEAKEKVH